MPLLTRLRKRRADRLELHALLAEGIEAMRLTREYVGETVLPAVPGWSWFDWSRKACDALGPDSANTLLRQPGAPTVKHTLV